MIRDRGVRLFRACVAAWLLLVVTPGATELVEDAVHFLAHGDSLHDAGHESAHHCCSGAFHVCGCHPHQVATPTTPRWFASFVRVESFSRVVWPEPAQESGPADAHALEVRRPPAA